MSRHSIFYHFKSYKQSIVDNQTNHPPLEINANTANLSDFNTLMSKSSNKGGRPSLLQTDCTDEWQWKIESDKVMAAYKYKEEKKHQRV
jgi:hypothetical protein